MTPESLLLEIRDEAGCMCPQQDASVADEEGEGLEVSCSWLAEPMAVVKYEGGRVILPHLRVPTDVSEKSYTICLRVRSPEPYTLNPKSSACTQEILHHTSGGPCT